MTSKKLISGMLALSMIVGGAALPASADDSSAVSAYNAQSYAVCANDKVSIPDADAWWTGPRSTSAIGITINAESDADGFRIYRFNAVTKQWVVLKDVANVKTHSTINYTNYNLKSGTVYKYKVAAYKYVNGRKRIGDYSDTILAMTALNTPKITSTSANTKSVNLHWKKVNGARGYKIQKYNSSKKKWTTVAVTSNCSDHYKVSGLKSGTKYKFRVAAYAKLGNDKVFSDWSKVTAATK